MKTFRFVAHTASLAFCLAATAGCIQAEQPPPSDTHTHGDVGHLPMLAETAAAAQAEARAAYAKMTPQEKAAADAEKRAFDQEARKLEAEAKALLEEQKAAAGVFYNEQTIYSEQGTNRSGEAMIELEMKIADVNHRGQPCKVAYVTNRSGVLDTGAGVSLSCKW